MHKSESPLRGVPVKLLDGLEAAMTPSYETIELSGEEFVVDDWWDRVNGASWQDSTDKLSFTYNARQARAGYLPMDDEVLLGRIGNKEVLVHLAEIDGTTFLVEV